MSELTSAETVSRPEPARKYTRPRRYVSWVGLILGLAVGIGGGLFYAWGVNPVKEFDTEPWQLEDADKAHYIVAVMLDYSHDSDLNAAVTRLLALKLDGDPIQAVADVACDLATTGYVENNSGLHAIRAMMTFYQLQGKHGCADNLIPSQDIDATKSVIEVIVPTATLVPPPTKTSTPQGPERPTSTPFVFVVPTSQPQTDFALANIQTFCSAELSGLIEVYVQESNGDGIAGQEVRVRWDSGEDHFFTGLKPERGPGYADFEMVAGKGYTVEMPGRSDPTSEPLSAAPCTTDDGARAITSYRVVFRPLE
jgi:hypothetical protein